MTGAGSNGSVQSKPKGCMSILLNAIVIVTAFTVSILYSGGGMGGAGGGSGNGGGVVSSISPARKWFLMLSGVHPSAIKSSQLIVAP